MQVGPFLVNYSKDSVVTLTAVAPNMHEFDRMLEAGEEIRRYFERSKAGSDWGCDGVGYACQKRLLCVSLHRSGVGPRNYKAGLARLGIAGYPVRVQ